MSERGYPAKEEALRRLTGPQGDHELHTALERMRLDHPHLWGVLHRVHLAHDAEPAKLEATRSRTRRRTAGYCAPWATRSRRYGVTSAPLGRRSEYRNSASQPRRSRKSAEAVTIDSRPVSLCRNQEKPWRRHGHQHPDPEGRTDRHLRRDGQTDVPQDVRRRARAGRGCVAQPEGAELLLQRRSQGAEVGPV